MVAIANTFETKEPFLFELLNEVHAGKLQLPDFQRVPLDRAKKRLNEIERATGKSVAGRDSDETVTAFGGPLS